MLYFLLKNMYREDFFHHEITEVKKMPNTCRTKRFLTTWSLSLLTFSFGVVQTRDFLFSLSAFNVVMRQVTFVEFVNDSRRSECFYDAEAHGRTIQSR